ncbi:MAG: hypothetical protein RLZZ292_643 [Bacteroidota bacterium]|jgi:hypothetical protein
METIYFREKEKIDQLLHILEDEKYDTPSPGHTRWDDLINSLQYQNRQIQYSEQEKKEIVAYINPKIAHWKAEERTALYSWWIATEVEENWEYGVNGVGYTEKHLGIKEHPEWLFFLCKKAIFHKSYDV